MTKFLRKVREYKAEDSKIEGVGATIVHCSAGVGRTGVTIALDAAVEKIEKNQEIDPRQLLTEMREQRGCLIQEKVKIKKNFGSDKFLWFNNQNVLRNFSVMPMKMFF